MESRQPDESRRDVSSLAEQVFERFRRRLESEHSVLVQSQETLDQLRHQATAVVRDVLGQIPGQQAVDGSAFGDGPLLAIEIGASRALRGVHPVESLRAASALFDAALSVLAARDGDLASATATQVSVALHRSIMNRVAIASLAYVSFLMEKLQASRQEERRRIARELHDRVGHGMGLALQHLDLHRLYAAQNPQRAEAKLDAAITSLGEALRTVQQLSAELRRSVTADGFERSLRAYLRANVPASVAVTLRIDGDAKRLPSDVNEELYLIVREAVRNALRHAEPKRITIDLEVTDTLVRAEVTDDGRGFDPDSLATAQGGGLPSMRERAELLRGRLDLTSRVGEGTRITVLVPLGEDRL